VGFSQPDFVEAGLGTGGESKSMLKLFELRVETFFEFCDEPIVIVIV
jgi:hypothetical protein